VPLKDKTNTVRKAMITDTWLFTCGCLRCVQPKHKDVRAFDAHCLCSCGMSGVCVFVCVFVFVFLCVCVYTKRTTEKRELLIRSVFVLAVRGTCVRVCVYVSVLVYVRGCIHMNVYTYICTCLYIYLNTCRQIYYIYTNIYIFLYIYMHRILDG